MEDGMSRLHVVGWFLVGSVFVSACAPAARQTEPGAPVPPSAPDAAESSTPKAVRIGVIVEPKNFQEPGGGRNEEQIWDIAHAALVKKNDRSELIPDLVEEVPSIDRGTWKLNPDGTMELTWRLRPNVKWHDGQALSPEDLVFGWEYAVHPLSLERKLPWLAAVDRISTPDARTVVVHYKQVYALANQENIRAMPRHILGSLLTAGEIEELNNHLYWRDDFVGLGPFRLTKWDAGSQMEFSRFDDYFVGRPRLDRVIYAFYPDPNTLIGNILAGEVDVHLPTGLGAQQALDLEGRWASGTGNQVMVGPHGLHRFMAQNLRPETARPVYMMESRVRQALYRAFDKDAYNQAMHLGRGFPADSWIPPTDARRQNPAFRDSIVQYPHEPERALRELEALGWRRGADGMLVNQAGERFEFEVAVNPDAFANVQLGVVGDMYRQIGVSITQTVVSAANVANNEYLSNVPAWQSSARTLGRRTVPNWEVNELASANISTAANRWVGANRGAYRSADMDALYDRLNVTIAPDQRDSTVAQMLRVATTDLPVLFTLWDITVVTAAARVKNVSPPNPGTAQPGIAWNIYEWDVIQ
jgi:peptide/nickel transport system substrate-binding protein